MKSNILTIMKKEFARFFGDKRMIIMILLPGVLIYAVYSLMGTALKGMFSPDEDYTPRAYAVNMPVSLRAHITGLEIEIIDIGIDETEDIKEQIAAKSAELCIVFPDGFDAQIMLYDPRTSDGSAPNIELYFNSVDMNSANAYRKISSVLDLFESSLANKFDVNRDVLNADLATVEDTSATIISSMLPMLLMIFLYSGCMALAPESIAGEKERGTIATLLVTPMKRSQLAVGKILSLGVLSFLCGLVSAVATMLSLPKLMGNLGDGGDMINVAIYSAADYALLAFVILTTILLLVTVISIISAFSKTVKEAATAVTPLMIIVMLVGVTAMFSGADGAQQNPVYYLIPVYSSVQSMSGIFSLDYNTGSIALSCLSNIIYACAGGFALTKMFCSEKVMFSS